MISNDEIIEREELMSAPNSKRSSKMKKPKKPWSKKKKRTVIGCVIGGIILIAAGVAAWFLFLQPVAEDIIQDKKEPVKYYSPLTGMETSEANTKLPVTAVMIENSPEARPQSGLAGKNVVFEAVAEGGITRFNVLFQEEQPELIGPIRSLRSYYLEWASGFNAGQAHVGGSGDALNMIKSSSYVFDIDETPQEVPIWRANDRYAPHNAYSSGKVLHDFETQGGKTTSEFTAWERQDGAQIKPPQNEEKTEEEALVVDTNTYANVINLPVSTGLFAVSYEYSAETNSYNRFQGGAPHSDREKGQISPNVVIAMMVSQHLKSDGLHNDIQTTGSGVAYIFQNGVLQKATWKKSSVGDNIEFVDENDNNIKLNRGQTWITAIDNSKTPTWQ